MDTIEKIKNELRPIKTREQYKQYLSLIDRFIDSEEDSQEEEVLELISILVEDFEARHYPIDAPDPIDAIKLKTQELGLKRKDLSKYFGSVSRVSEVLNRKRPLSLEMARKLHKELGISAETLLA
jgi:HTH-type transcriptional regulator/antitoxin HigA